MACEPAGDEIEAVERGAFTTPPADGGDGGFDGDWVAPGEVCSVYEIVGDATSSSTGKDGTVTYTKEIHGLVSIDGLQSYEWVLLSVSVEGPGTFTLGSGQADEPYIWLYVVSDSFARIYQPSSGVLTVEGNVQGGSASLEFDNLKLDQLDSKVGPQFESCISFFDFTLDGVSKAPSGWTCSGPTFNDGVCHCGCGVVDSDCLRSACESCDASGSCAASGRGCELLDPRDSTSCIDKPRPKPTPELDPIPGQTTTWDDVEEIFNNSCGCHDAASPYGHFLTHTGASAAVNTGDPEASLIWLRINDPVSPMPPPGTGWVLQDAEGDPGDVAIDDKKRLEDWIADGALE